MCYQAAADSGTDPRYRSQVITLADQLAIAAEDEVGQEGGAAVLFKCLLSREGAVRWIEALQ